MLNLNSCKAEAGSESAEQTKVLHQAVLLPPSNAESTTTVERGYVWDTFIVRRRSLCKCELVI